MQIEILTKEDLQKLREEIVNDLKTLLQVREQKKWLRTRDVIKILQCSPTSVQNLRIKGQLPYTKVGGAIYYLAADLEKMMVRNMSRDF